MPKGIREPLQELEGGKGFGGMGGGGGGGGGSRFLPDIRVSAVEARARERAATEKRELQEKQRLEAERAADEARYLARKDAGLIKSSFPRKKDTGAEGMKKGGMTASSRADGCAQRGKTRGKMV